MPEDAIADRRPRLGRGLRRAGLVALCVLAGLLGWFGHAAVADRPPGTTSVDVGFLRDMSDHHDQAVQLAFLVLANGSEPAVKGLATDVIASQRYEIGLMEARLRDWGHDRGTPDRSAMAWMGMPTAVASMPGMVDPADIKALTEASGRDADALFLRLMTGHHEGGVHMGQYARTRAQTERVRRLARIIATAQTIEIFEMEQLRARLALPR